jgi:hypothetical protein
MALIRGHHNFDDHFTQIPNDWVRDDRLSLEARGLLAQIMSHKPGWNLSIKSLAARNNVGRDKMKRIIDELLKLGYLERSESQGHDNRGHLAGYNYTTKDPQGVTQEPYKAEPYKAEPSKADRPPKKTITKEENKPKETINIETAFSDFWELYPKKVDKRLALRSFEKALKRASLDVILNGAKQYRDDPGREDRYTKNPSTWLNADAWDNEPLSRKLSNAERAAKLAVELATRSPEKPRELPTGLGSDWVKGVDDVD